MKPVIDNYIDAFYLDFINNYTKFSEDAVKLIAANNGYDDFQWNTWWPESELMYPSNRQLDFRETNKPEDHFQAINLNSNCQKNLIKFYKITSNNPILNSYFDIGDHVRSTEVHRDFKSEFTLKFASKYDHLTTIAYGSLRDHAYIYNEYKQILLLILDTDLAPDSYVIKKNNVEVARLSNKLDKAVVLMDAPFSIQPSAAKKLVFTPSAKKVMDTNKFFLFAFEFEEYT